MASPFQGTAEPRLKTASLLFHAILYFFSTIKGSSFQLDAAFCVSFPVQRTGIFPS
jgi:hypothetical protein